MKITRYRENHAIEKADGEYRVKTLLSKDSVGVYLTTVKKVVREHHHPDCEEVFIFITKAKVKINGKIKRFNPKDILHLKRGEKHKIWGKGAMLFAIKIPNSSRKVIVE